MGMFDRVYVPCPVCSELSEFQSKSGDCTLAEYTLADVPADVIQDVNRQSPNTCSKCGTKFRVKFETTVKAWAIKQEDNPEEEEDE